MSRRRTFALPEVLDEAAETVAAVAAPYLGLLWLTALPLRMVQAHLVSRLFQLGEQAGRHGTYLLEVAVLQGLLLLPWAWGRAVFVRACRFGLRGERPGAAALRVGAGRLAAFLYVTLLIETLFWATAWTLVTVPVLVLMGALAAATHPFVDGPGLVAPLRQVFRHGTRGLLLSGLLLVLGWAWVVVAVNLHLLFQAGVWLVAALPGVDAVRWSGLLQPANGRYVLVVLTGALLAVEPYLLAAATVYVHKLRARGSGEDLRLRFERLRRAEAA